MGNNTAAAWPAPAPLADLATVRYGYTGTSIATGPAALSAYGYTSLSVSWDGRYVALATTWAEDHALIVLEAKTGQPAGRTNGWYPGHACAIGMIAMDSPARRDQAKGEDGSPGGGWQVGILTTRQERQQDGSWLFGAYHGGFVDIAGTVTAGLGPGNSWNEWRPGNETEIVQDYDIADVALCRGDALAIFADRTNQRLMLFDRARPLDYAATKAVDRYFPVETGNTLMRLRSVVPLPAAPLRVAPLPDGSAAWVILDTEPRSVVKVSLE